MWNKLSEKTRKKYKSKNALQISKKLGKSARKVEKRSRTFVDVEANVSDGRHGIPGQISPDVRNIFEVTFDSESDVISSGIKRGPVSSADLCYGDQKGREAPEGRHAKNGREDSGGIVVGIVDTERLKVRKSDGVLIRATLEVHGTK